MMCFIRFWKMAAMLVVAGIAALTVQAAALYPEELLHVFRAVLLP